MCTWFRYYRGQFARHELVCASTNGLQGRRCKPAGCEPGHAKSNPSRKADQHSIPRETEPHQGERLGDTQVLVSMRDLNVTSMTAFRYLVPAVFLGFLVASCCFLAPNIDVNWLYREHLRYGTATQEQVCLSDICRVSIASHSSHAGQQ